MMTTEFMKWAYSSAWHRISKSQSISTGYLHKNKQHIGQRNRTIKELRNKSMLIYSIYEKRGKIIYKEEKTVSSINGVGKLEKNGIGPVSYTMHKNKLKVN